MPKHRALYLRERTLNIASSEKLPGTMHVAVVLPPREGFGPDTAGAIGLLQARLAGVNAAAQSRFSVVVLGVAKPGAVFAVPFKRIDNSGWFGGATSRYARGILRTLDALAPDLVEIHNRPDVAARICRRFPAHRIALFLHNDPRRMRGASSPRRRAALSRKLGRIICVSAFLRDCWMEGVTDVRAPEILPNSLDLAALPTLLPTTEREPTILFAGRLVADKGADIFVAACALALPQLPGWRADMIGADRFRPDSPETPFTRGLRRSAAEAGVSLLGFRNHGDVMTALSRAAIAVVPSRWQEPFGLTALEAMASGSALVTSSRGGLGELAEGTALIADPEDPAAVAEAILLLARDISLRERLAEAGRQRAANYDLVPARALLDRIRTDMLQP
jgi:UDP-glucose:(glucosyl)LPS alpha-1,2-glucosyltransferase